MTIADTRIQILNDGDIVDNDYVLYWMQQSQRVQHNPALDLAIREANRLKRPVLVLFGLTDAYPDANLRHYRFMLEGLQDVKTELRRKGIPLVVRIGEPTAVALELAPRAALIVCDRGYTRHQRQWRETLAREAARRVIQVEGDVVVPVAVASGKAEYAARTIRPKITRHIDDYLRLPRPPTPRYSGLACEIGGIAIDDIDRVLARLAIDRSVPPVTRFFEGGTRAAKDRLRRFVRDQLAVYGAHRNQPQHDGTSAMSPYLHFGQISPIYVALQVRAAADAADIDSAGFLEELIVRRELAVNFVHHTPDYDRYTCLPGWARRTLWDHAGDTRDHRYAPEQLERAQTHDPYWNAAMLEMRHTGYMHNYMRMYWGKKILEWSDSPEAAFETALAINNKYFLDGRDPNSYAGVAWVFGTHDRAWFERPIFGKVRYMAASGLKRKCDIQGYVEKVKRLMAQPQN